MAETTPQTALRISRLGNSRMRPRPRPSCRPSRRAGSCNLLQWVPVEAGIYRLNTVKDPESVQVACTARDDESELPQTFVDYDEAPRNIS